MTDLRSYLTSTGRGYPAAARLLGCDPRWLRRIVAGRRPEPPDLIQRLAAALSLVRPVWIEPTGDAAHPWRVRCAGGSIDCEDLATAGAILAGRLPNYAAASAPPQPP